MLTAGSRALVSLILFFITLAASVSSVRAHSSPTSPDRTVSQAARAEQLTVDLGHLNAQYQLAAGRQKARLEADLIATAVAREQELLAVIDSDPGEVLRLVLSGTLRSSLPASVRAHVEEELDIEGVLEILHEDRHDGSRYHYGLETATGKLSLHFADEPPTHLLTGARVRAHGFRLDGTLALGSGSKNVQTVTPAPSGSKLGAQRTVVILVNFSDSPAQPYTLEYAQGVVFGTTSNFFLENSFQQTWLSGDVVGWFTIASSSSVCDTFGIATQAQSAASAAGVDLAAYTHYIYAFPQNDACYFWGRSTVGGNPSQIWINGDFELGVTAHELGHGLGLWHSHSLDCGATTLGSSCTVYEYGDTLDMMGASSFAHFNAFQKERLGWLNAGISPPIATVQSGGTFTLETYELAGSGPKALKILKSTDPSTGKRTWYYVQSRQAIGFDEGFAGNTNVLNGVLIHYGTESNGDSSYLLDMTPASGSTIYLDWRDPGLAVGQTFADPDAGVTITTNWVTSMAAEVTVSVTGTGTTPTGTVSVTTDQPSYSTSQTVLVKASVQSGGAPVSGAAVSFTIKKPTGTTVKGTATTGADGTAVYNLRLKRTDPAGLYEATAARPSSSASTSFTVR
jgi:gametolysin peptidase M11